MQGSKGFEFFFWGGIEGDLFTIPPALARGTGTSASRFIIKPPGVRNLSDDAQLRHWNEQCKRGCGREFRRGSGGGFRGERLGVRVGGRGLQTGS